MAGEAAMPRHGQMGLLRWWVILHIIRDCWRSSESCILVAFDMVEGGVRGGKWGRKGREWEKDS